MSFPPSLRFEVQNYRYLCVFHIQVKREELLQFAQGAITGLKLNADIGRCITSDSYKISPHSPRVGL